MANIQHKPRIKLGTNLERYSQTEGERPKVSAGNSLKKGLLLDDDQVFCKIFQQHIIQSESMLLETTSKVNIFLSLLQQHSYDVCIIDYDLYQTTGIDVISQVREFSDIPAVLISASYTRIPQVPETSHFSDYVSKWVAPSVIVAHSLNACYK